MMNRLYIIEGTNTPKIYFDPDNNQFEITGKSFPEHAKKFYQPVFDWFRNFQPVKNQLTMNLRFHYISTSSILVISELLKTLSDIGRNGCKVTVRWHYDKDDDDLRATGEDLIGLTSCEIELVPH
ncbi:MAG: DUF1987 domain-containing protein [Bacteroidetes bacterium]|nr:DUF1987 domain-containing protein [Bacteroidota bacterium]